MSFFDLQVFESTCIHQKTTRVPYTISRNQVILYPFSIYKYSGQLAYTRRQPAFHIPFLETSYLIYFFLSTSVRVNLHTPEDNHLTQLRDNSQDINILNSHRGLSNIPILEIQIPYSTCDVNFYLSRFRNVVENSKSESILIIFE